MQIRVTKEGGGPSLKLGDVPGETTVGTLRAICGGGHLSFNLKGALIVLDQDSRRLDHYFRQGSELVLEHSAISPWDEYESSWPLTDIQRRRFQKMPWRASRYYGGAQPPRSAAAVAALSGSVVDHSDPALNGGAAAAASIGDAAGSGSEILGWPRPILL